MDVAVTPRDFEIMNTVGNAQLVGDEAHAM
jgi:hypothetical protein